MQVKAPARTAGVAHACDQKPPWPDNCAIRAQHTRNPPAATSARLTLPESRGQRTKGKGRVEAALCQRVRERGRHRTPGSIVRIRHGGELIGARGMETAEGLLVILDKEIRGIASGQSAVFYSEDGECLGGGVIA